MATSGCLCARITPQLGDTDRRYFANPGQEIQKIFLGTGTGGRGHDVQEVMELSRAPGRFLVSPVAQGGKC